MESHNPYCVYLGISLLQCFNQVVIPEFLDVLSAVEASILEMENLQPEVVEVGDLVLALFEDGAYYRAGTN